MIVTTIAQRAIASSPFLQAIKRHAEEIGMTAWVLLAPLHPTLLMLVALPLVDLCLGVAAAWKRGEKLRSNGLGRTIGKIVLYASAVLLGFATEQWLIGDAIPVLKGITTLIGLRELKSCLEHLDELHGGSLLKTAIDRLVPNDSDKGDTK